MYVQKESSRQAPGIFSYVELLSSRILAYTFFFGIPIVLSALSLIFYLMASDQAWVLYFFQLAFVDLIICFSGVIPIALFYSKKAPLLRLPPKGWGVQLNFFFTALIGGSYLFGKIMETFFLNPAFQEIFLILGSILTYIIAFVIYFSFTTVGKYGNLILSLIQPITAIILYSIVTFQFNFQFLFRAIIFFIICAALFAIPYGRGLAHVSRIYKEATGLGGYSFIRAFTLSIATDGNDERIERLFDRVGVNSKVKTQYIFIQSVKNKNIKGLFVVPHVHFGPFKTCGSSDLPEHIYKAFKHVPGITVYHTTNDHAQNLTNQAQVNKMLNRIKEDFKNITKDQNIKWEKEVIDFSRKISNSAKLMGMKIGNTPIVFLTRHPLPSDDIRQEVGTEVSDLSKSKGFSNIIVIDSHNSIIGDEILIKKNSVEAKDLIKVSKKYLSDNRLFDDNKVPLLYGVAKDNCTEFSEKDGIGFGGMVVHFFKDPETEQKTVLIHFDGNNAFINIRSFVLNMLQNRGIEKGEITTSDSHTVARQLTRRGYSPIGDKIKIDVILKKLDILIKIAEENLEPVEFYYYESVQEDIRIWGDEKYFNVILSTLQECIRVSQRLLSLSLIVPTFLCFILLLFFYNI